LADNIFSLTFDDIENLLKQLKKQGYDIKIWDRVSGDHYI
jgi:hypothetical protein